MPSQPRTGRHAIRVLAAALVALILLVVGSWFYLRSSLPQTSGTVVVSGLSAPVTVTRDAHGIPTIVAETDADAAFALGYVHAQDRLFQMDLMRHYGAGRLAEWFGAKAVPVDRFTRTLGLYRAAAAQAGHLAPAVRSILDAYAAGVNAWIATHRGALPPEYEVLRVGIEPWKPADTLVWGKVMDLQLTANFRGELLRARMLQRLTPAELDVLYPPYPDDAPVTGAHAALDGRLLDRLAAALPPGSAAPTRASNNWVVAGQHTVSGKPLLANDTHLGLSSPGVWYLARIEVGGRVLAGVTAPGTPFMVVGHNTRIAWGFTTTGSDVEDLFVEQTDPHDPARYLAPGRTLPFVTRQETIRVRGGAPVVLTVRATRHGPVISDLANWNAGDGRVLALATTWLVDDDRTPNALWNLSRAGSWAEFRAALRDFVAPQQNIVYADVDGNIGFIAPARVPIRAKGNGWLPAPGASGAYDWTGFVPFDDLPQEFDPPSGRLATANNRIVAQGDFYLGSDWDLPYRIERILTLLDTVPKQSPTTAAAMQADVLSPMARALLPLMLRGLPHLARDETAIARLATWDDRMDRMRSEPLIFAAWLRETTRALFAAKLGPLFPDYWAVRPNVVRDILVNHPTWCGVAGCPALLGHALDRALDDLRRRYGDDMAAWQWGDAHRAIFAHPVWSRLPLLHASLTPAIAAPGASDTLDAGAFAFADEAQPFADRLGPVMRVIVDMAHPAAARFMIVPGQSGNPLSPHWADLLTPWRNVRYVAFSDDISGGRLVLMSR
ncbi:MAG: penicillin acylase family protein [Alphaproteobacteria bacterium]|nr:penicillin acylase family protein [Alphaproteobacteria bacterium]